MKTNEVSQKDLPLRRASSGYKLDHQNDQRDHEEQMDKIPDSGSS
jgi:hypothetical protein